MMALSGKLFFAAAAGYFLAMLLHIVALSSGKDGIRKTGLWLSLAGFLAHTAGLLTRYIAAGHVEVSAFERADGRTLQGWEYFRIFVSHPPFTNLYESLVFMAWGVVLISVILEFRNRYPLLGLFSNSIAVLGLGLSSLLMDNTITPLVPALQSWWLHAHVAMAASAYGAFLVAAVLSFLFLLKTGVKTKTVGLVLSVTAALMLLGLARGTPIFKADYSMSLISKDETGKSSHVYTEITTQSGNKKEVRADVRVGTTGTLVLVTFGLFIAAAAAFALNRKKDGIEGPGRWLYFAAFVFLSATLLSFIIQSSPNPVITTQEGLEDALRSSGDTADILRVSAPPPYYIGMKSNPYDFALLIFLWLISAFHLYLSFRRESLATALPDPKVLDNAAYRVTIFAFPMMSLVIVTGAVWAHYAWGRYWGWDPKETWSLITWFLYAFYLHARITHGWVGRRSAVISVIGFAVVIFTYLGVNLGLTGTGLHVYGKG